MKPISTFVVLAVVLVIGFLGCGDATKARLEVAKEAAIKKLDSLLGSMDVKRKEIDIQLKGLSDGVAGIKKAKLKAQTKLDELNRKAEPIQAKLGDIDTTLKKYRDLLAKNESVELAGKTLTPDQLKANAEKLITARKQYADEVASYEKSKAELQKVVDSFDAKQRELDGQITSLKSKIAQIDSQMVAVKALKDAKSAMGDGSATIGENVSNLENKVSDLLADVKVELASEGDAFDEATANKQIDSIDSIIAASQEPKDTLAEIDKILGASR